MGTFGYISPEQLFALKTSTIARSVLARRYNYQTLTLQLPYGKEMIQDQLRSRVHLPRYSRCSPPISTLSSSRPSIPNAEAVCQRRRIRGGLVPRPVGASANAGVTWFHRAGRSLKQNRTVTIAILIAAGALTARAVALSLLSAARQGERQTVLLNTDPSGASVAFIPLDNWTGEPDPDRIIDAATPSPIRQDLPRRLFNSRLPRRR